MSTKHETVTRYPLSWPVGWQRTPSHKRRRAAFTSRGQAITVWAAIQRLQGELDRLGAREPDSFDQPPHAPRWSALKRTP